MNSGPEICSVCHLYKPFFCQCGQPSSSTKCPKHPGLQFANQESAQAHLAYCGQPNSPTKWRPYARPGKPIGVTIRRRLNALHDPNAKPRSLTLAPPITSALPSGGLNNPPQNSGIDFHNIFAGLDLSGHLATLSTKGVTCYNCYTVFSDVPALQGHIRFCKPM